jgi:hypothetical protein
MPRPAIGVACVIAQVWAEKAIEERKAHATRQAQKQPAKAAKRDEKAAARQSRRLGIERRRHTGWFR